MPPPFCKDVASRRGRLEVPIDCGTPISMGLGAFQTFRDPDAAASGIQDSAGIRDACAKACRASQRAHAKGFALLGHRSQATGMAVAVKDRAMGSEGPIPSALEVAMTRKKILLVDDSRTSLFMEQMILKKGPYDIVTAGDGQEAVEKATAFQPDLIVMDVIMPRMTGFEACAELRKHKETEQIPVILVTTRGEGDNVEKGYAAGCNDYVTKPVNGAELLAKVRNQLAE
jgi:PleD family two-component response regulator